MMTDEKTQVHPDDPEWLSDIDLDVITVRRYDTNDILVGLQYFVLMRDESMDDAFFVSSVARPPEPVVEDD